jgi:hypothetical protein
MSENPILDSKVAIPMPSEGLLGVETVLRASAKVAGVTVADLKGASPGPRIAPHRARAVLILRRLRPDLSSIRIGQYLGNRDHSTILHAEAAAERRLKEDPDERCLTEATLAALGQLRLPPPPTRDRGLYAARLNVRSLERQLAEARARLAMLEAQDA